MEKVYEEDLAEGGVVVNGLWFCELGRFQIVYRLFFRLIKPNFLKNNFIFQEFGS